MPEFQECDRDEIVDFVRKHPFGLLSGVGHLGQICATHVPLLLEERHSGLVLRGHVMRKTDHWQAFHHSPEVLAVFTGPDAPVLASWQGDRTFGGTWNYLAVHMRGPLEFLPEPGLIEILKTLKDRYETDPSARFDSLPSSYVSSLVGAIEGFEIQVSSVQAVFKLSQNRNSVDFDRTVEELRGAGGEAALVATEMSARRQRYYPA